ncbi:claudin-7-like isoform X3 [Mauremys mutica]|uniref:claudin-7-like isoform X3 n=2 Tax=Mauremys mutica TaxID=74926 RepID=UPI001D1336B0|nr:claudin-7-like isoform X3 [Mauremys mutica]XP_044840446.1 claudin-7-like isoform X3 [Mauremys mutica]XP_044840453.1 claudin-7-like isoform X3 [Mauremys mutica]
MLCLPDILKCFNKPFFISISFNIEVLKPAIVCMADSAPDRAETEVENLHVVKSLAITSHIPLLGFVLSVLGWILCVISIGLIQWRVWHVDNTTIISSGTIWIGIWDVCFTLNPELANGSSLMLCQRFTTRNTFIPSEIFVAQDLLMLATIMEAVAIGFTLSALWALYKKELKKHLVFFLTGGILNIISSVFILIPVSWNLHSIMKNRSIAFPPPYHLPSTPKSQEVGAAIPVGLISVLLLLLGGFLLLCDRSLKLASKVYPKKKKTDQVAQSQRQTCQSKHPSARPNQTYPQCGSFLEIELWGPRRPFGMDSLSGTHPQRGPTLTKNQVPEQEQATSFQIPIGPLPHRSSKCVVPDINIFIIGEELPYF